MQHDGADSLFECRVNIDGFGAPVSHNNQDDVDCFYAAARLMLGFAPDPEKTILDVLKRSPDFIMGHCFLAGMYLVASDKRKQVDLAKQYAILKNLAPQANERERGHIAAIKLWLAGDFYAASQAYATILFDFPRDLTALQFGHQIDFLLGQVNSNRDRPARVLGHWSSSDQDFSFVLGMQAFGLEEAGHYSLAEDFATRCVGLNPKDCWGVHALAHCYEMQGKTEAGIRFMEACEAQWAGDNYLSVHNRWHLSLYHIETCAFDLALDIHDEHMQVDEGSVLMDLHDSAALLWRLSLDGVDVGERWEAVAKCFEKFIDQAYLPFNDMHAMMAFVATGREAEANALITALKANSEGHSTSALVIKSVGLPVVQAIQAFGRKDYQNAKEELLNLRHSTHMMGGSIAQRDVINLTLMEAAIQTGDKAMVNGLIGERTLQKPHSPLVNLFEGRLAI